MAIPKYAKPEQYLKRSQTLMRTVEGRLGLEHTPFHGVIMPQIQKKPPHEQVFHTLAYASARMRNYLTALSRNCGAPDVCKKVAELREESERLSHEHTKYALGVYTPRDLAKEMHDRYKETGRHFVKIAKLLQEHPELKEKYKEIVSMEAEGKKKFLEEAAKKEKAQKEALERLAREYESKKS